VPRLGERADGLGRGNHGPEGLQHRRQREDPLPASAWAAAVSGSFLPEDERTADQREALALAQQVAAELRDATSAVLALPLHNSGVSQRVKTWFDLAVAGAPHGTRLLDGMPVVLVVTRGGACGAGTPREGWDHSTDYLRRIRVDVRGADPTVVEREFTLVGVNPALDEFTEVAELMSKDAEDAAAEAGAALAARYTA
jgi:FMN-dependent NADH-azoreductase